MALPSKATVDAAIDSLLAAVDENKTLLGYRANRRKILEVASRIEKVDATYDGLFADGAWTETDF